VKHQDRPILTEWIVIVERAHAYAAIVLWNVVLVDEILADREHLEKHWLSLHLLRFLHLCPMRIMMTYDTRRVCVVLVDMKHSCEQQVYGSSQGVVEVDAKFAPQDQQHF
jgi:hypothetical protein